LHIFNAEKLNNKKQRAIIKKDNKKRKTILSQPTRVDALDALGPT